MTSPVGYLEVVQFYGDPAPFVRDDGTVAAFWELRMTVVPFPEPLPLGWNLQQMARGARVNEAIADETETVFGLIHREGLWRRLRTYDGGYVWRTQRGSGSKLSMHAFGAALDFNEPTNKLGRKGDMDLSIVQLFEACGWTWGGRFARPDCMHFQMARSV